MPEDYKLSKETHELILKLIIQDTFNGIEVEKDPVVCILGGQPGAGKVRLLKRIC